MFSIVVPVYNVEKYLEICINSILSQTYQDFELILIDDGSTDSSGVICDNYQRTNPEKIKVIHQSNAGLLSARITGLHETKGRYIYNADSDDFLDINLLEKVKEVAIDKSNADVIVISALRIDADGNQEHTFVEHMFPEGKVNLYDYWYKWVNFYQLNSIWLKVFKRKLLDQQFEIEIKKYIQIEFSEDLIYSIPAIRNASSIYYLDQSLYYYRINPKSITANYKKGEHLIASAALPAFLNALNFLGFNDQKIQKQLYDYYLYFVWVRVYLAASTNQLTDSERNIVLNEIQSYEAVQQAYTHLNSANINMLCKIGLNIFYKSPEGKYAALCAFSKLYNKFRNLKVKLFTVS